MLRSLASLVSGDDLPVRTARDLFDGEGKFAVRQTFAAGGPVM
jgi:hypothetical protein